MYKVKVNANYFDNTKTNKQSRETEGKLKFSLNELQKQYLETLLPKGYKLILAGQVDQKRNRTPRKADAEFDTQFFKRQQKRQNQGSDKKIDRKDDRKVKQKESINSIINEVASNINKSEEVKSSVKTKQQNEVKTTQKIEGSMELERGNDKKLMNVNKQSEQPQQNKNSKGHKQVIEKLGNEKISGKKQKQDNEEAKFNAQQKYNFAKQMEILKHRNQLLHNLGNAKYAMCLSNEQKQFCQRFLSKIKAHKSSWPFRQPVDPINQGVPNYLQIVKQPMDLKTIEKKINSSKYEHVTQFHGDINKIFLNSYKFNPKETNYYTLTLELEDYYHQLLKELQSCPNILEPQHSNKAFRGKTHVKNEQDFVQFESENSSRKNNKVHCSSSKLIPQISPSPQICKEKVETKQLGKTNSSKQKTKYSENYRRELRSKVLKLSSEALQNVVNIVFGRVEDERQTFELDFQKFSDEVIENIENVVKLKIKGLDQNKTALQTRMLLF